MFHARRFMLSALRTGVRLVELFGMLPLHDLVVFSGHEFAEFVTGVLDLGPGRFDRWSIGAVLLAADDPSEFLDQLERLGRESGATFFDSF